MIEALTAEDAALLCAEAPGTQLQIGALCFFRAAPFRDDRGRIRVRRCAPTQRPGWASFPDFGNGSRR